MTVVWHSFLCKKANKGVFKNVRLFNLAAYAASGVNIHLIIPHLFSYLLFFVLPFSILHFSHFYFYISSFILPSLMSSVYISFSFPSFPSNHVSYILLVHGFPSFPPLILNALLSSSFSLSSIIPILFAFLIFTYHYYLRVCSMYYFCYPSFIFHSVIMWLVHQIKIPWRKVRNCRSVVP